MTERLIHPDLPERALEHMRTKRPLTITRDALDVVDSAVYVARRELQRTDRWPNGEVVQAALADATLALMAAWALGVGGVEGVLRRRMGEGRETKQ